MSVRKRRLFVCASCRRIHHLLNEEDSSRVDAAETLADQTSRYHHLIGVREASERAPGAPRAAALAACRRVDFATVRFAADQAVYAVSQTYRDAVWAREKKAQAVLVREVAGNPFRPVTADPAWLTSTAVALAQGIYADRAFDRLPILADALEEAGCDDTDVLSHLRGDRPHVRGCWAVDLVLDKE